MNKIIVVCLLTILTLVQSACGGASSAQTTFASDPTTATLPVATQLLLGTFKLEGTNQTMTADQATELLPLWQVYSDLITSDTAAQEEIDALIEQIQNTMTTEQLQAIKDMKLTGNDMFTLMQEQGINLGTGPSASGSSASSSSPSGGMPGGDSGAGGPPADMGASGPDMGGQSLSPDQIAAAQASGQTQGEGANLIPSRLIDALIHLLEKKAASQ
jgi:hypothetical protein